MSKKIKIQPFDYDVVVFTNKKKFNKYLKKRDIELNLNSVIGYCCKLESEDNNELIMLLPFKYDESVTIHESLHLTWFILEIAQIEIDSSNHEIQAYLLEHTIKQIKKNVYSTNRSGLPKK